jgi:hypothetical protein
VKNSLPDIKPARRQRKHVSPWLPWLVFWLISIVSATKWEGGCGLLFHHDAAPTHLAREG